MAKKSKVNKAEAIRVYAKEHPEARPSETVQALKEQGIVVTPQQVSTTLTNERKKLGIKVKARRGKAKSKKAAVHKPSKIAWEEVLQAKELVDQLGSISKAKAALDALSQFVKK